MIAIQQSGSINKEGTDTYKDTAPSARTSARSGAQVTPETDPAVAVDGPGPTLFFQRSDEPKTMRNRVHLDVATDGRADEVARLKALGARVRDAHDTFTVMLDPEGNEFCVRDR